MEVDAVTTYRRDGARHHYQIRVEGRLDGRWSEWFNGLVITPQGEGETLLTGSVADQAALHGVLAKIRDLGLPLLSVIRTDGDTTR